MSTRLLEALRRIDPASEAGLPPDSTVSRAWGESGVRFVASTARMQDRYHDALRELNACVKPAAGDTPILHEGGIYHGCWLESTGTINAELLSRFVPQVAEATFTAFAEHQREDGLFPYKLTPDGAVFSQIQTVTPLARSVWTHYRLNGGDKTFLGKLYAAMSRNDAWLARWRDTRRTGTVEAFCAYDTGHDLSARFWHVPDSPAGNDPTTYDESNPILPFIAPDLTANVACQRQYLASIAEELGEDGAPWRAKAAMSQEALFRQCFHAADAFFYDRDREGQHVRVQSDVLLRVLACEIGDEAFFAAALKRYLLNTAKFFAKYPFTSIALDDPRFDPAFDYNSWCGPTNMLSVIRAPHAFEHHHRHVELSWAMQPVLSALFRSDRFAQTLHPFTGRPGFTETYSPAILCLLDFVERLCGIQPRPDGALWFTGLPPAQIEHRDQQHETGYARRIDGRLFELVNAGGRMQAWRDGALLFDAPLGLRLVTRRDGTVTGVIGMRATPVSGEIMLAGGTVGVAVAANQELAFTEDGLVSVRDPGMVTPTY